MRKNKSIFQCMKCGGKKMQQGGTKRQVTPEEYQASLQQGYKQISPNTAVKNTQQNQLKAASATRIQAGQMTAQEKAKYDNWVNQQISSGTSPLKLYELGYISKEQADRLQLSYKPTSDTIYFNKPNIPTNTRSNVTFAPYGNFNYEQGLVKGMMRNDTLFFQPDVPQHLRDKAKMIYELTHKRDATTTTKNYFSPGVTKLKRGGMTLAEIRKGLPLQQLGGVNKAPDFKFNKVSAPEQFAFNKPVMVRNQISGEEYKVNPGDDFVMPNMAHYPSIINTVGRMAANLFGPQMTGYQSNPFDNQWGQQQIGDMNVAQLGGLLFGPSMKKGGKKWRGQFGGYNFLGQMRKSF